MKAPPPRTQFVRQERIKFAEERKEQGNALLKQEHHQESITRYVQALTGADRAMCPWEIDLQQSRFNSMCWTHRPDKLNRTHVLDTQFNWPEDSGQVTLLFRQCCTEEMTRVSVSCCLP